MKFLFNILALVVISFLFSSCRTITYGTDPASIGELYNFKKILVKGGNFWITTYQKITDPDMPYVFYVEGDGAAFNGKYRVSHNPTPRNQMILNLAAMDKRPNVVYVARPCQYTPMNLNPTCTNQYWTGKRLSDDSVQALNEAINSINRNGKFSIIGYSGGGGIAVLIAARNSNVKDIITIAGNLDIQSFTTFHNVTPMIGSLNPIDYANQVRDIPQLHLSGGKDKVVPPFIADKFVQEASSICVKQQIFVEATHRDGWKKIWEYIYTKPLICY